jgi:predicted nucleic acid-binding protein
MQVAIDSSVLVALINPQDIWRERAISLQQALLAKEANLLYFDCVVGEALSTATRRLYEKQGHDEITRLFLRFEHLIHPDGVTWVLTEVPRLYPEIITLMKESGGELNFHDALIALVCRERGVRAIASFDADFDRIAWLQRIAHPEDVGKIS